MSQDLRPVAALVARAPNHGAAVLVVTMSGLCTPPKLRVAVMVDHYQIDVVVEQHGRRLGVIFGRSGDQQNDEDRAITAALERAGWAIYRLPESRVRTRPTLAVSDVLAALHEHGKPVPKSVARSTLEPCEPPLELLRQTTARLAGRS